MIGGLKRYPAMRDSGVPWLGDVFNGVAKPGGLVSWH
jgi:hypothetical protein